MISTIVMCIIAYIILAYIHLILFITVPFLHDYLEFNRVRDNVKNGTLFGKEIYFTVVGILWPIFYCYYVLPILFKVIIIPIQKALELFGKSFYSLTNHLLNKKEK